ncbi:MAG: hypothetical protein JXB23_16675 [Candidatus Aminicenantes bacterium]|nr:hypothetical protein [Candidatus Aminicenantes bacterium]
MESSGISKQMKTRLLAGVFLVSLCLLSLEIVLTRILSVMFSHHYVFIVVSVAVLGLGTGGIFIHFFREQTQAVQNKSPKLSTLTGIFALSIPFTTSLMAVISGVGAFRNNILVPCFLLILPFFFAGALLAQVFRMFPAFSAKIYGADLMGAATGALVTVPILSFFGGLDSCFLIGLLASLAAVIFVTSLKREKIEGMKTPLIALVLTAGLLGTNLAVSFFDDTPIGLNPEKQSYVALKNPKLGGEIVETRWNAYGRTDLVKYNSMPDVMVIYIDGTAGSPMLRFNGDISHPGPTIQGLKAATPGFFPFFFLKNEERDSALIIGPGGGRDILLALLGGIRHIKAVEINESLLAIVREYHSFNGGIYTNFENVSVVADEGRNYLRRHKQKNDIILLQFPYTESSRSLEGYVLTENFLFTANSFQDYWDNLTDEGRLVIACNSEIEIVRLFSTSLLALKQRGISQTEALKRIYALGSPEKKYLFVLGKIPFSSSDMTARFELMQRLGYQSGSSYFPYVQGKFNPEFTALSKGELSLSDFIETYEDRGFDIKPVTDNTPFFFKFNTGIPRSVSQILWVTFAGFILVVVLPPLNWKRKSFRNEEYLKNNCTFSSGSLGFVLLFSLLGTGFMLAEISLIQRFVLFLGKPVISLSALLFSMLAGAGLGSLRSGRFLPNNIVKGISSTSFSVCLVLITYVFLLPFIFKLFLGAALSVRLTTTVILLASLGFIMGFPFPLGIRLLKEKKMENHIPWMWGINGVGSVLGSVSTIILAMKLGFTAVLFTAAGCYFVIFLTSRLLRQERQL